jgi:hypothetical protein
VQHLTPPLQESNHLANPEENPPSPSTTTGKPPPNSNDFADHLRTVHFSLLATCLALAVIFLGPSPLSIRTARRQLDEIAESAAVWNPAWLQTSASLTADKNRKDCWRDWYDFEQHVHGVEKFLFRGPNWVVSASYAKIKELEKGESYKNDPVNVVAAPKTLAEFRQIWDVPPTLICVVAPGLELWVREDESMAKYNNRNFTQYPINIENYLPINESDEGMGRSRLVLSLYDKDRMAVQMHGKARLFYWTSNPGFDAFYFPIPDDNLKQFDVPFRDTVINSLAARFQWRHTAFSDAFPELDKATDGFQHLAFRDLK